MDRTKAPDTEPFKSWNFPPPGCSSISQSPIIDAIVKFIEDVLAASTQSISKSYYVQEALSATQLQTYMGIFTLPVSKSPSRP
ncbi:hypothetical protein DEU56DRAFT_914230 [Suillus clintonianus]|uniref:uncharacterized protein n=1 Tax=Suillus clintonianus TaxID=1904413 RepID=UPI001B870DF0|nr:uncharacterized protein DEU56DRAFT_914230 [Suillus clintonianus]KAG2132033.1 hypothetical protein DEU56DRAFT_914230 [Suillus clintonianus]